MPIQPAELANSLARRSNAELFFDDYHRALYSTDASIYQIQPLGVVVPRTVDDVAATVEVAREHGVSIVPRGAGTSLSGQSIGAGLVIDFSKYLNRILEIDPAARTARIEPGVVLDQLNAAAAAHRLQFGPDVATSNRANIGGMIGNNSAGARSVVYGKTVDHVISLKAFLADGTQLEFAPLGPEALRTTVDRGDRLGKIACEIERIIDENRSEIIERFPRLLRRVSGYNLDEFVPECLTRVPAPPGVADVRRREAERFGAPVFNLSKLLVGAEGGLGVVTEVLVHLLPLPAARGLIVLHFDSLAHAVAAITPILECEPSAAELFDAQILRLAEQSLEYRNYLDFVVGRPESLMLVEFSGESLDEVRAKADRLAARLRGQQGLFHVLPALDPVVYSHVWACRKAALPLLQGIPGVRKPVAFVEDAAIDPRRLSEFVERFRQILARHDTDGAFYGHASVGCLHIRPMLDLAEHRDLEHLRHISREVCDLVIEFGGSMSGEHGDGLARSYLNERLFGPKLYQVFLQVKAAFDPENRLNPGKVVNGPSPVENLRLGEGYKTLPIDTVFDYPREGSLVRAAEMCNGAGVCRKRAGGTMCPSYMATGDEEHATRGRANALRLVLSGAVSPAELTGKKLFGTFDLCLECKGCKAECPSNVDVAKMKMEFLSHYYAEHGAPLGVRLMAHAARMNRIGSALAPMSNWAAKLPGAGWIAQALLGIDARRPLPRFARENFRKWHRRRNRPGTVPFSRSPRSEKGTFPFVSVRGPIVLLDDCLTTYCEPNIPRAAVAVLEAAGYEVHLAGLGCCGRTFASKGFLREAQALAERNLKTLHHWAVRGVPIVGCEPSCVAMLIDEYLDLVPGEPAREVAACTSLVESHLARSGISLPFSAGPEQIAIHGHCHQKALIGISDTRAALAQIPGATVEVLDTGCCGMAGSFGYEHYDLSMKIGELALFPAVRSRPAATLIAPGFSCRHQISHATGRIAKHPVELLAECLAFH